MATYKRLRYLFMTLDPVHIGTGSYRLGRVDNSIVREPGTKIPKIPGTSLHGAARSYAAQLYGTPEAAGQDQKGVIDPGNNPICYTFGYLHSGDSDSSQTGDQTKPKKKEIAYSGVINIFDGHILLFPVHSMFGPVWVSTKERLDEAGLLDEASFKNLLVDDDSFDAVVLTRNKSDKSDKRLNLGWLMLNVKVAEQEIKITAPDEWQNGDRKKAFEQAIKKIVIVKESLFSQVVNSNLEIRTSVAIDPKTGAAYKGALFTYEAIPRGTFLTTDVVLDDYRVGQKENENGKKNYPFPKDKKFNTEESLPGGAWQCPLYVVEAGFRMIEWLGVGGMGTRGFGRIAMIGKPKNEGLKTIFSSGEKQ